MNQAQRAWCRANAAVGGNRRLGDDEPRRALAIIRERYTDFVPALAREKLYECHGIRLAKERSAG